MENTYFETMEKRFATILAGMGPLSFVGWAYLYAQVGHPTWLKEADERVEDYGKNQFINEWLRQIAYTLNGSSEEERLEGLVQTQLLKCYMECCPYRISDRRWKAFYILQKKLDKVDWQLLEQELVDFWLRYPIPEDLLVPPVRRVYDDIELDQEPCFRWDS